MWALSSPHALLCVEERSIHYFLRYSAVLALKRLEFHAWNLKFRRSGARRIFYMTWCVRLPAKL
jgi:hypothetical protein